MDIDEEAKKRLEESAANVDDEINNVTKDPKSVKKWITLVIAVAVLGFSIWGFLAGLGIVK